MAPERNRRRPFNHVPPVVVPAKSDFNRDFLQLIDLVANAKDQAKLFLIHASPAMGKNAFIRSVCYLSLFQLE